MSEKIIKIKTKLDYDNGYNSNRISSNIFKISPSSFETFFSKPHLWFQQMFLNENKFEGNTASYLGTTVHFLAHQYFINNKKPNWEQIFKNKKLLRVLCVIRGLYLFCFLFAFICG